MYSAVYYTHLCPFQGLPPIPPLNTPSPSTLRPPPPPPPPPPPLRKHCYLNLLFPALSPAPHER